MQTYRDDAEAVVALSETYRRLKQEIGRRIIGQETVVERLLMAVFSRGHALLVGVPGLAKTLLVQTVADVLDLSFKRIQFTPDLMPSDITGSEILDSDRRYRFVKGPLFAHLVLADEINRTPPKTQAALLEAMQEKAVTVAGERYALDEPFFVFATQNPIEQEGTYPLPEAQLDRFMMEITLDYPQLDEEVRIVKATTGADGTPLQPLLSAEEILYFQQLIRRIPVPDSLYTYAVQLVAKTRPSDPSAPAAVRDYIAYGAGPRASQYLIIGAKCHAALNGRFSPDKTDVQAVAEPILRHRVVRNYRAEAEGVRIE
ncbi:MAG: AAA family ATPase, partial [Bacteroidales bacterium]|nr:AAA family ATPase [Bacteroidales bacterium]